MWWENEKQQQRKKDKHVTARSIGYLGLLIICLYRMRNRMLFVPFYVVKILKAFLMCLNKSFALEFGIMENYKGGNTTTVL